MDRVIEQIKALRGWWLQDSYRKKECNFVASLKWMMAASF